ncbi:MAG: hypothetical protein AVDCRST_MAG96-4259 [uncultured Segetibacter sp.]|uniref:Uncharacterized protein n=1 Tax=uncultured Segetibacter sp. TaxID=481133 RepID=A0A6J4U458_9BACT|nr:MAG: hypothetical protein AVDCRST_MAG96-4259 [uncultured Segetibacter sp.]
MAHLKGKARAAQYSDAPGNPPSENSEASYVRIIDACKLTAILFQIV